MKILAIIFFGLCFLQSPTSYSQNFVAASTKGFRGLIGPLLGPTFPTTPMTKGLKIFTLAPSYFSVKVLSNAGQREERGHDISGFGLSASYLHGFSNHLGVTFLAGYEQGSGKGPVLFEEDGSNNFLQTYEGDIKQNAFLASVNLIYDPFSEPEGFRLPLFIGIIHHTGTSTRHFDAIANGNSILIDVENKRTSTSLALGFSPQFNVNDFRFIFYGLVTKVPGNTVKSRLENRTTSNVDSSEFEEPDGDQLVGTLGIEFLYRPWDLGLSYAPNLDDGTATFITLKWKKKFGGEAPVVSEPTTEE